jgi:hypothetical protein
MVHFLDADVFGQEFATICNGNNLFTMANDKHTDCYLFDDTQLRNVVKGAEDQQPDGVLAAPMRRDGMPSPCTGPIVIPPIKSGK